MRTRDTNLDLLRAIAILMVLVYHICQRWAVVPVEVNAALRYGAYGVDLFFVLSGWLIGSLLWREHVQFGNVEIGRFIGRRALRTVPPYLVALVISYTGVFVVRQEPFNWGYLVFAQNYYESMPYFLISWSLCIEEQFYLVVPFLILGLLRVFSSRLHLPLLFLAFIPMLCRFFESHSAGVHSFGYHYTATHLRYEGLLLGVWASLLRSSFPQAWSFLHRHAPKALVPMLAVVVVTTLLPDAWHYTFFYSALAVFLLLLLVAVVDRRPICFSNTKAVFWIASTSYSVYLTHAFTLDAAFRLLAKIPAIPVLQGLVILSCVGISGVAFYRLVEIPSLALRHRWMPGRTAERSPLLDSISPPKGGASLDG